MERLRKWLIVFERKAISTWQFQNDKNVRIIKYFKAADKTMLHKENELNGNTEFLRTV